MVLLPDGDGIGLNLLSAPTGSFGIAHVARGLNGRDELEDDVGDTDDTNGSASNLAEDSLSEEEAADEDVEESAADEGEEEGGVSRDLGRDLELEKRNRETENDHVHGDNNRLQVELEDLHNTTENGDKGDNQVDNAEDV